MFSMSKDHFQIRGPWQAEEGRFENEREKFDFDGLEFLPEHRSVESVTAPETDSSGADIASKLDLEHAQRLVQRSSGTNRSGMERFRSSRSMTSSSEFQLDQLAMSHVSFVGRDEELSQLTELYKDPNIKMVNIVGESGSGKSVLAQALHNKVSSDHGFFCGGKFDVQNRANPYLAIAEAVDEFIRKIAADQNTFDKIRKSVQESLGQEGSILSELVPAFQLFEQKGVKWIDDQENAQADSEQPNEISAERSITERASRIQNVFVSFIKCVSSPDHPLVIVLDDIQWAGPASMAMVDALLSESSIENFFLVTTCRRAYLEIAPQGSLSKGGTDSSSVGLKVETNKELLDLLAKHGDKISKIQIHGLGTSTVQDIINTLFRMDQSPRTNGLATIVQQKTGGNPYFVLEFMRALVDEELVLFDTSKLEWTWFDHEISSRNVADNVAEVVAKRLQKLDPEDLLVAQIAACLSRSFESETLKYLLAGVQGIFEKEWDDVSWPHDLEMSLQNLVIEGILERQSEKSKVSFAHDQLQQAAFSLIPKPRRVPLQHCIGKRLIDGLDSFRRAEFLFTAVELYGTGIKTMKTPELRTFAFWAFVAGDAALKQGAFQAAMKFLHNAVLSIGDDPFKEDSELALPLFSGAAEAACCVSDFDKAAQYIHVVESQKSIPAYAKIRVSRVLMKIQCGRRDFHDAAKTFRNTIKDLGLGKMPKSPGILSTLYELTKTVNLLKKFDQETLIGLPLCTNPTYSAALSAHAAIGASLYVANPNLFVIAGCRAVRWSLEYGVSKDTPTGFCTLAIVLVSLSDTEKALELAESALALCEMYQFKEAIPLSVALVFGFVRHWTKPMQQFLSPLRYGIEVGTRLGCMDHVAVAMNTYGILLILTSTTTLPESIREIQGFLDIMEGNHDDQASFTKCNLQFALKLASRNENGLTIDGSVMTASDMREVAKKNEDVILDAFVNYFQMQLFVYFGKPVEAARMGKKLIDFGFKYAQGTHMVPRCTFMIGLSNVLSYKQNGRKKYLRVTRAMIGRLKKWAKQGNPNVLHFLHLLEAELFVVAKKQTEAQNMYVDAMIFSKRMGYSLDFALSNELFALFQRDYCKDSRSATYHMEQAVVAYASYGALNIVDHLKSTYPDLTVTVRD